MLVDLVGRLTYLRRLREAALARYQRTEGKQWVRCSDVARHVAELLDIEDSPYLRRDLRQALKAAGWRYTIVASVTRWKGVVAR
jgi:hypothetical protein